MDQIPPSRLMHLTTCNINMNVPVKRNSVNVLSFTEYTKIKELSMTTHDKPPCPKNELVNWMDSRFGEGGPEQIKIKEVLINFHRQSPVQEVRTISYNNQSRYLSLDSHFFD